MLGISRKQWASKSKVGNDFNELLEDLVKDFNFIH